MKKITADTFLEYKFLSDPIISPNGENTAFLVHKADDENNNYHSYVYIYSHKNDSLKKLTSVESTKDIIWDDDETLLFPAVRSDKIKEMREQGFEVTQYYRLPINGGEAMPCFKTEFLSGKATKLSDGKYLFATKYDNNRPCLDGLSKLEQVEALKNYKEIGYTVFEEAPFWSNGQGVSNRIRTRLAIYDSVKDSYTYITKPMFDVTSFSVKDDRILYSGCEFEDIKPVKYGLYLYNCVTSKTTLQLEPETLKCKGFKLYTTDKAVVVFGTDEKYGLNQNGDVYIMDLNTNEKTLLAKHDHQSFGSSSVGSDARFGGGKSLEIVGDMLYYSTTSVNHSYINTIDLKTGDINTITNQGCVDSFDIHGDKIVMIAMKKDRLGELYMLENSVETKLTSFNEDIYKDYFVSSPEEISVTNKDDIEIYGYVMKPFGYAPGNSYPAILHIHGGPRTVFSDVFHNEMQFWASQGYFVLFCNPRGSDGRGNEFGCINGVYGTIDYDDIMMFTDKVLDSYSDIDKARVGVTGGSYGGFMTNWIIGHTDRFACACAQRSIANWTSFEGTTDIGYYFAPDQVGASHMDNQELQWAQSPLKYADKAVTPTLFIHSDQDYRCWMVEGLQMFSALKMHGTPAKLCLFKGENHELSRSGKPRNRIKRMEEILAWMDNYLK